MKHKKISQSVRRAWTFAKDDVWDIEVTSLSALKSFGIRAVRVVHLVFTGFKNDECPLHASALTFSSLMAVVPILALTLALARGLGGDDAAKEWIRRRVNDWTQTFSSHEQVVTPDTPAPLPAPAPDDVSPSTVTPDASLVDNRNIGERIEDMVDTAFDRVENISFKALGGFGLALLFWMVIQVLGRVESSFNRVWGVTAGRSLFRRFTDYLSALLILPILIMAASSLPVVELLSRYLNESAAQTIETVLGSGALKNLTVFAITVLAFSFLLMFMPNTRVRAHAGLLGGFVAGALFLVWLSICAAIQVGAARYGRIYGSFAIVPILLAWVYVSWEIVLFGAEVAFAVQNCNTYRMEQGARRASVESRILLSLSLLTEGARSMTGNRPPLNMATYAKEKRVPVRFVNDVVDDLESAGFVGALAERTEGFVLLKAPEAIKIMDVIHMILRSGVQPAGVGLTDIEAPLKDIMASVETELGHALNSATIRELAKA